MSRWFVCNIELEAELLDYLEARRPRHRAAALLASEPRRQRLHRPGRAPGPCARPNGSWPYSTPKNEGVRGVSDDAPLAVLELPMARPLHKVPHMVRRTIIAVRPR